MIASANSPVRIPPTAHSIPIVGAGPLLIRDPLRYCARAAREHGDVVRIDLGLTELFMLWRPAHLKHVLQDNNKNYGKGRSWEALQKVVGKSLATADGAYWLKQRRTIQPGFRKERLRSITVKMIDSVGDYLAAWERKASDNEIVDVHHDMKHLTLHIMLRSMFGVSLTREEKRDLDAALPGVVNGLGTAMWASYLPDWLPLPGKTRFQRSTKTIDRIVARVLRDRRDGRSDGDDLISMLLNARDPDSGEGMTDLQLRDELVGMFLGAFETTSLALTWTLYALSEHPDVEERMRSEIQAVAGSEYPNPEQVDQLGYVRAVFEEAMRFYPPGWVIPRQSVDSDEIAGYAIPERAILLLCTFLTHRDPEYFERPDEFHPEHFLRNAPTTRPRWAYLPFGYGPRTCIGNLFAMLEAVIALTVILQRFQLTSLGRVSTRTTHITVVPRPAFHARIRRR